MDSCDFVTCTKCGAYEICYITQSEGLVSGLLTCPNHDNLYSFCKNCYPDKFDQLKELYDDDALQEKARRMYTLDGIDIEGHLDVNHIEEFLNDNWPEFEAIMCNLCPKCNTE